MGCVFLVWKIKYDDVVLNFLKNIINLFYKLWVFLYKFIRIKKYF